MSNNLEQLKVAFGKKPTKKKPQKEPQYIRSSRVDTGEELYEQIVNYHYVNSKGETTQELEFDGLPHRPITGEELDPEHTIVLLPEYPQPYFDVPSLVTDLRDHINKYYDCDEQTEKFGAWYILLSWVFDRLNTINYLRAQGDFGTGKSRYLDVVGRLCYKPIIGSGAGSVAALKRMVQRWRGTVLIDEGDFKASDEKSELVKFLNLGFEKNRAIYQCNKNDPEKIEFYIPYCPKVIATRKSFSDHALESRCLTHITQVTKREDIPIILPNAFYKEEMELRNQLLQFRFDHYYKIDPDNIQRLRFKGIEPRLKQALVSFGVMFKGIPEMEAAFMDYITKYQQQLIEDRAGSFDGAIVNAIIKLLEDGQENITSQLIKEEIEPQGFNATVQTIGRHIKGLGLKTKHGKVDGKVMRRVNTNNLIDIAKRYSTDLERLQQLQELQRLRGQTQQQLNT